MKIVATISLIVLTVALIGLGLLSFLNYTSVNGLKNDLNNYALKDEGVSDSLLINTEYNDTYFASCGNSILHKTQSFIKNYTGDDLIGDDWFISADGNEILNNQLKQSSLEPFDASWTTSKKYFAGDFSIEVDFSKLDTPVKTDGVDTIFFVKGITKDLDFFNFILGKNFRGIHLSIGGTNNIDSGDAFVSSGPLFYSSFEDLKIKMTRIYSTITVFVDDGTGFREVLKKTETTTDPVSLGIGNQNFSVEDFNVTSYVNGVKIIGCEKLD